MGKPVKPGTPSEKVYITNLYNQVLPLIRFGLTGEVTVLDSPCPCGSVFRTIADPEGRLDDTFVYPRGVSIHPHIFRTSTGRTWRPTSGTCTRVQVGQMQHRTPHVSCPATPLGWRRRRMTPAADARRVRVPARQRPTSRFPR
jgi:hypothetical protein